jgi:hypothetical protein
LEILALRNVVVKEVEEIVGLFLLVTHDAAAKLWVYEECFLACCWVRAHEWVNGSYWVATNDTTTVLGVVCLFDSCNPISICSTHFKG